MAIPICDELRQRVIFMGQELQNAQVNITHFSSSSYSSHSSILQFKSFLKMTSPAILLNWYRSFSKSKIILFLFDIILLLFMRIFIMLFFFMRLFFGADKNLKHNTECSVSTYIIYFNFLFIPDYVNIDTISILLNLIWYSN